MRGEPPEILILEANPVVAEDVAATVEDVLGACRVITVMDGRQAKAAMEDHRRLRLAVLCADPDVIRASGLDLSLHEAGAAVVLVNDEAYADLVVQTWPGWGFANTPFTTEALSRAITDAVAHQARAAHPPGG